MRTKLLLLFCLALALSARAALSPEQGKAIFSQQCAACHSVDKVLVGPALGGVRQRRSLSWILSFVKSPQAVIRSGDPVAKQLYATYHVMMPDHKDLTDDQIKSVLAYIASVAAPAAAAPAAASPAAAAARKGMQPVSWHNYIFLSTYVLAVIALVLVLLLAVDTRSLVREHKRRQES